MIARTFPVSQNNVSMNKHLLSWLEYRPSTEPEEGDSGVAHFLVDYVLTIGRGDKEALRAEFLWLWILFGIIQNGPGVVKSSCSM